MSRRSLSDKGVAALKPRDKRYHQPDPELRGHYIRVEPTGTKSFWVAPRDPSGKQVWTKIGDVGLIGIAEAREKARVAIKRIREGLPAFEGKAAPLTFGAVAERYLERHVAGLRSKGEVERILRRYVLPNWHGRELYAIRRSDVADLLDDIEDQNGAAQADAVLAVVRGLFNWRMARDDEFISPIARGMRRTAPAARARSRILTDDEIKALWEAAGAGDTFGDFVKMCLLTGQRRAKVASLRWDDVNVAGEWTIPADEREKGTAGILPLPEAALAIIRARPRLEGCPYIFAGRGDVPLSGFAKRKRALDETSGIADWRLHDLRRTARSLMSRAGVRPDIAERVLGHAIPGVEGVYDRHQYRDEKAEALARLAAQVERIVNPPAENVVPLREAAL